MGTSIEKKFNRLIEKALSTYEKAVESTSPEKIMKRAEVCIEKFDEAKDYAIYIDETKKIPYLNQYIALSQALIGEAKRQLGDLEAAKQHLEKALTINKESPKNRERKLRELYFKTDLLSLAHQIGNLIEYAHYSNDIYKLAKKVKDSEIKIKYLRRLIPLLEELEDFRKIKRTFRTLLKIVESQKGQQEFQKTRAEIYEDYGDFLHDHINNLEKANEFYKKALTIFQQINLSAKVSDLQEKIH